MSNNQNEGSGADQAAAAEAARLEAEAKKKAEAEEKAKADAEAKAKREAEAKAKADKEAARIEAAVLVDCRFGNVHDVVLVSPAEAESGKGEGVLELHPAGIAAARKAKG